MRYLTLTALLVGAVTACRDRPSPVEPVAAMAPIGIAAAQARPEPVDDSFETDVCGFTLLVDLGGKFKPIELGRGRTILIFPGSTATLTNPDNGKTETLSNTGTFHFNTLPNGNVEQVLTGRNTVEDSELGLLLTIGTFSYVYDAAFNIVQPLQGKGRTIDLCDVMS